MKHFAIRVWQERPGEMSWRCACGIIHKHQSFGVIRCIDDAEEHPHA